MRGAVGGRYGVRSPGGTLFPLLLAALLVVAESVIVVVVESVVHGHRRGC